MKVSKNPLDLKSHTERMVQNPNSESSDSRRPLLALMNCIYELQKKMFITWWTFYMIILLVSFAGLPLDPADCISLKELYHGTCIVVLNEVFMKKLSKPIRVHAYTWNAWGLNWFWLGIIVVIIVRDLSINTSGVALCMLDHVWTW